MMISGIDKALDQDMNLSDGGIKNSLKRHVEGFVNYAQFIAEEIGRP